MADAHLRLQAAGETLSIVLGDPAYYGRAGYDHDRAAGFGSDYQGPSLQALAFGSGAGDGAARLSARLCRALKPDAALPARRGI